jgi:hypothetical protein
MDRHETLVHQVSDTFDYVAKSDLDQMVAGTGSTAYAIADALSLSLCTHLMPRSRTCSGSAMQLLILAELKSSAGCHPIRGYRVPTHGLEE